MAHEASPLYISLWETYRLLLQRATATTDVVEQQRLDNLAALVHDEILRQGKREEHGQ